MGKLITRDELLSARARLARRRYPSIMKRVRFVAGLSLVAVVVALASGCGAAFGNLCEQRCHGTKSAEPSDFDDCMKRCHR